MAIPLDVLSDGSGTRMTSPSLADLVGGDVHRRSHRHVAPQLDIMWFWDDGAHRCEGACRSSPRAVPMPDVRCCVNLDVCDERCGSKCR